MARLICLVAVLCVSLARAQTQTLSLSNYNDDEVPGGPEGIYNYGIFKISATCEAAPGVPCGRPGTRKSSCMRHGCCWNPTQINPCFYATFKILNYKDGISWGQWENWSECHGMIACTEGVQHRWRKCDGRVGTGGCQGNDYESQSCTTSGCSLAEWSQWSAYGPCSVPSEPLCFAGVKTRARVCIKDAVGVSSSDCFGGSTSAIEVASCNTNLCTTATAWVAGVCSQTCGTGTATYTRSCLTTGTSSPSSCFTMTMNCNTQTCPSNTDKTLDLVFLIDSSYDIDQCVPKGISLSVAPPHTVQSTTLTRTNFPAYFREKDVINTFVSNWKNVNSAETRMALHANAGACLFSQNLNFLNANLLSEVLTTQTVDNFPMYCKANDLIYSATCVNEGHFITQSGERTGIPNVLLIFLPDTTTLASGHLLFADAGILATLKSIWVNIDFIVTVSTIDVDALTPDRQAQEKLNHNKLACLNDNPGSCDHYCGHIYMDPTQVLDRCKAIINSGLP